MGVKERKERERLQRTNDILEAAKTSFESKGFLKTTLQDVANEAEISVGLIYRYFQSKEDIFAALALKGAEEFDQKLEQTLKRALTGKKKMPVSQVLSTIAQNFFDFYAPYGEYFDMLLYSYKGNKEVQIHGATLTKLMSVTLSTLDQLKEYILKSSEFRAKDEDEALRVVFLLWGVLLGCHKLFDNTGRGHLFAFNQSDFLNQIIGQILQGIANPHMTHSSASRRTNNETSGAHLRIPFVAKFRPNEHDRGRREEERGGVPAGYVEHSDD